MFQEFRESAQSRFQSTSPNVYTFKNCQEIFNLRNDQGCRISVANDQKGSGSEGGKNCSIGILAVTTSQGNQVQWLANGNAALLCGDMTS